MIICWVVGNVCTHQWTPTDHAKYKVPCQVQQYHLTRLNRNIYIECQKCSCVGTFLVENRIMLSSDQCSAQCKCKEATKITRRELCSTAVIHTHTHPSKHQLVNQSFVIDTTSRPTNLCVRHKFVRFLPTQPGWRHCFVQQVAQHLTTVTRETNQQQQANELLAHTGSTHLHLT